VTAAGTPDAATTVASTRGVVASTRGVSAIPQETAGPYPGDGTNGPNVLIQSGVVRRDLRASIGGLDGMAQGVPLSTTFRLLDSSTGAPLAGAALYLWHCDRDADYSMYTLPGQNYLRGVQVADAEGLVTFDTIFPAAYAGRWPHLHFEVFPSLDVATSGRAAVRTSQLAIPAEVCDAAYAAAGYERSRANFARVSLADDVAFRDGASLQTPTVTGDVGTGFSFRLDVGV
jgi:protocatechuate 3,4-dioxygenase beta subunit